MNEHQPYKMRMWFQEQGCMTPLLWIGKDSGLMRWVQPALNLGIEYHPAHQTVNFVAYDGKLLNEASILSGWVIV